jgi:hypothetical protein
LNNSDGYSVGTLLGYRRGVADRFEFGLLVPYRFASLNDPSDTTAHFAQLDLFGTFTPYDKAVTVKVGADAFTSVLVSESKTVDIIGNLTYGGGLFSAIEKGFKPFIMTFGVGFKLSKTTLEFLPDTSDILGEIIEALNDREVDQDLTLRDQPRGAPWGKPHDQRRRASDELLGL